MGGYQISKHSNLTKIGLASFTAIGTGYTYLKLQEINNILGKDIIQAAEKQLLIDLQDLTKDQISSRKQNLYFSSLENTLSIYEKRFKVYRNRLLHFNDYKQTSQIFIQKLVKTILEIYEEEGILQNTEIMEAIRKNGDFNNKFTEEVIKISQENRKIKEKYSHIIQKLLFLQNKLITVSIIGLSENSKEKIDLLYQYIKERNLNLAKSLSKDQTFDLQQWSVEYQQDYLSKFQLI